MKGNAILAVLFTAMFLLVAGPQLVFAGPPLVCHPIKIGSAHSLPNGNGPFGTLASYDRKDLVEETLDLLKPDMPVLVRMETLRRATLYASGIYRQDNKWSSQSEDDRRLTFELLSRLTARALQDNGAMTTFDVGYLMACYEQANIAKNLPGYELIKKALALSSQNAELEFACALVTIWPENSAHKQHLQKARAAAPRDALLASNLESHFGNAKTQ